MKKFKFKISTRLKDDIKDPKGEVIEKIADKLNIIKNASIKEGKFYEIVFEAENKESAKEKMDVLAKKVLTNPIVEIYTIEGTEEID